MYSFPIFFAAVTRAFYWHMTLIGEVAFRRLTVKIIFHLELFIYIWSCFWPESGLAFRCDYFPLLLYGKSCPLWPFYYQNIFYAGLCKSGDGKGFWWKSSRGVHWRGNRGGKFYANRLCVNFMSIKRRPTKSICRQEISEMYLKPFRILIRWKKIFLKTIQYPYHMEKIVLKTFRYPLSDGLWRLPWRSLWGEWLLSSAKRLCLVSL